MSDTRQDAGSKEIQSLTEQLLHAFEELDLLHGVCEILSTSADPDEANKHILREAMATLAADLGWVIYDDGQAGGRQMWRQNIDLRTATFVNEAVVNEAMQTGQHVWTDHLAEDIAAPNLRLPKAFLSVPLKTGNDILGAICLGKHADGRHDVEHNQLGAFVNQVEAQRGKSIDVATANRLIAFAQDLIATNG